MKMLIVEDNKEMRERIKTVLKSFKDISSVKEIEKGEEAIDYILEENPGFITLDIHLFGESGINVLKKIRANGYSGKIVVLTGYNYPIYKAKCLEYGADYFLNKSDDFEKLPVVISEILREG